MDLEKLNTEELHKVLATQMRLLAESRDTLNPDQREVIRQTIDEIMKEIESRR